MNQLQKKLSLPKPDLPSGKEPRNRKILIEFDLMKVMAMNKKEK